MIDPWPLYLTAFLGPFVQEDAAIIGAVTAFLHPTMQSSANGFLILLALFLGLVISDLWKYWIGFGARHGKWARNIGQKKAVLALGTKIRAHPGKTLMFARFVPGTRIPAYVAAGFFGVPFGVFAFWIVMSGAAYVGGALALLSSVGAVAGETGQMYVAIGLIVVLLIYLLTRAYKHGNAG
jgi:membrane protein DedA with SNARE-associated domain